MRRMLEEQEDVFYYVTAMNENYVQPALEKGAEEGILRGMYPLRKSARAQVRLLGSGTILRECLAAAELLEREHGVAAEVWSVTSWSELRRDAREADAAGRASWIAQCLAGAIAPVIAASDYVSALADLVRPWVPGKMISLGTDGFGRSDTRAALRQHFGVSAASIARAALAALR